MGNRIEPGSRNDIVREWLARNDVATRASRRRERPSHGSSRIDADRVLPEPTVIAGSSFSSWEGEGRVLATSSNTLEPASHA